MNICATTAQFPGFNFIQAIKWINQGFQEGVLGNISSENIQICPQSAGIVKLDLCEKLLHDYPQSKIRLHANARVLDKHYLYDLSTLNEDTIHYYEQLAIVMNKLNSNVYSIHSGYQDNCSENKMFDNLRKLQDIFNRLCSRDIKVAVEGLYPSKKRDQLIDCWKSYERLLKEDVYFAIDLSHLKIVAKKEKCWDDDLVISLLSSSSCLEIHLSDNNGFADIHRKTSTYPHWWDLLFKDRNNTIIQEYVNKDAVIFTEGVMITPSTAKSQTLFK